ncbi:MAG: SH3 domain-containing protein [Bacteroidia bacterium]
MNKDRIKSRFFANHFRIIITLILILFQIRICPAADHYQAGDKLYVWAQSGLNLRATPDINGKKTGQLRLGDSVEIISLTSRTLDILAIDARRDTMEEDSEPEDEDATYPSAFSLHGNWVKVKSGKLEGYVIDIYLLSWPVPDQNKSPINYFESLVGKPIRPDTTWDDHCDGAPIVRCYSYAATTGMGIEIQGYYFMSAAGSTLVIPGMTIEEGFVFFSHFHPMEDAARKKHNQNLLFLEQNEEFSLSFSEDELCGITFSEEDGKLYIRSGCSC